MYCSIKFGPRRLHVSGTCLLSSDASIWEVIFLLVYKESAGGALSTWLGQFLLLLFRN